MVQVGPTPSMVMVHVGSVGPEFVEALRLLARMGHVVLALLSAVVHAEDWDGLAAATREGVVVAEIGGCEDCRDRLIADCLCSVCGRRFAVYPVHLRAYGRHSCGLTLCSSCVGRFATVESRA